MLSCVSEPNPFISEPISPYMETGAYEAMWAENPKASFKRISELLNNMGTTRPSEHVEHKIALSYAKRVWERIKNNGLENVGVIIRGTLDYINSLYDAEFPLEMLY